MKTTKTIKKEIKKEEPKQDTAKLLKEAQKNLAEYKGDDDQKINELKSKVYELNTIKYKIS